jgi:hypothetical protein
LTPTPTCHPHPSVPTPPCPPDKPHGPWPWWCRWFTSLTVVML